MKCRHAKSSELDKVCELLASEFYHDPVLNFAFTDTSPARRLETMKRFFRIYIDLARDYGGILLAEDNVGVLVYFYPKLMEMSDEENDRIDSLLRQECGSDYTSITSFMSGLERHHPMLQSHYYVFLIAVEKMHRRKGVGSNLLCNLNTLLERDRVACYAECTSLNSLALFERCGYRNGTSSLNIDGFPELHPVWREAQSS